MTSTQHALAILVEERITQLISYRRWHRTRSASLKAAFAGLEQEHRNELRSLLRLRGIARRAARKAEVERTRAIDARVDRVLEAAALDGQQYEARRGRPDMAWDDGAYIDNIEGDPAFNGAFSKW